MEKLGPNMNQTDSDHIPLERSQLSALADGELSKEDSDFLLRRLGTDAGLLSQWQRYHVVRACLQQSSALALQQGESLQQRVSEALTQAPSLADSLPQRVARRWLQPAAGAAIAASVAVVAVLGLNLDRQTGDSPADLATFTSQSTAMDRLFAQPTAPVSWSQPAEVQRAQFNQLLHQHNHMAAGSALVPQVPTLIRELDGQAEPIEESAGEAPAALQRQDQ